MTTNLHALGPVLAKDLLPGQRFIDDEIGVRYVTAIETLETDPDYVCVCSSSMRDGAGTWRRDLHGDAEVLAEVHAQ